MDGSCGLVNARTVPTFTWASNQSTYLTNEEGHIIISTYQDSFIVSPTITENGRLFIHTNYSFVENNGDDMNFQGEMYPHVSTLAVNDTVNTTWSFALVLFIFVILFNIAVLLAVLLGFEKVRK
ncbi:MULTISPECIES: hypothetical protein [Bacillaceae]|uniref:Uncharacterized protein n=1 Tax=Evansella alkalicola TaxID=745819 RepID=A0ABS6JY90_9BACI|nr:MULTISPECIES: hypothetical protein [Bacillaceae]MBU9723061.1 hypothetical protein [Bacillus alkalicola]